MINWNIVVNQKQKEHCCKSKTKGKTKKHMKKKDKIN